MILWSDQQTTFAGTIYARGGTVSGNGGFVEASGHQQLTFDGSVDVGTPNGLRGTLLLDPLNALSGSVMLRREAHSVFMQRA